VLKAPEPRYRIVERGRRLVTIDTRTGELIGGDPSDRQGEAMTITPNTRSAGLANQSESQSGRRTGPNRPGRIAILIGATLTLLIILILSGAWIPVIIAMAIAPVRQPVVAALRAAVARYLKDETLRS
jgi:hypothetical protein